MTNRERAMRILHYQSADRLPAVHFGYWSELLQEWEQQGKIPQGLASRYRDGNEADRELDRLIGWDFNWYNVKSAKKDLFPGFEKKIIEILPDGAQRVQTAYGTIERFKSGVTSLRASVTVANEETINESGPTCLCS